jgi:hypothetical protein
MPDVLEVDPQLVAVVAAGAATLAVLLLVVVILQGVRLRRLGRAFERALPDDQDLLTTLGTQGTRIEALHAEVQEAVTEAREVGDRLRNSISKVGVVRYDAFDDMGGALSFSAALLDQQGDGMVISAINGRSETRCYAKSVAGAVGDHSLSTEEVAAVEAAMSGRRAEVGPARSSRRRRRVS